MEEVYYACLHSSHYVYIAANAIDEERRVHLGEQMSRMPNEGKGGMRHACLVSGRDLKFLVLLDGAECGDGKHACLGSVR